MQINSAYRQLEILDTSLTNAKAEETFINRVNLKMSLLQGLMTSSSFYELASGQELKREFYYLQVPVGSGSYAWNDYKSILGLGNHIFNLKSGRILIDKTLFQKGIIKAEFEFKFKNTLEKTKKLSWKGKIYSKIKTE